MGHYEVQLAPVKSSKKLIFFEKFLFCRAVLDKKQKAWRLVHALGKTKYQITDYQALMRKLSRYVAHRSIMRCLSARCCVRLYARPLGSRTIWAS